MAVCVCVFKRVNINMCGCVCMPAQCTRAGHDKRCTEGAL